MISFKLLSSSSSSVAVRISSRSDEVNCELISWIMTSRSAISSFSAIGTRRGLLMTGSTSGSSVMWYVPFNSLIPSKHSGNSPSTAALLRGCFSLVLVTLSMSLWVSKRLRPLISGRPTSAGPVVSVTKNLAPHRLSSRQQSMTHSPRWGMFVPPYALRTTVDGFSVPSRGRPVLSTRSGNICRKSLMGKRFPCAPVSTFPLRLATLPSSKFNWTWAVIMFSVEMSLISTTSKVSVAKSSATASTRLTFLSADVPFFRPYDFGLHAAFVLDDALVGDDPVRQNWA